ncbi:hypothetical protein BDR03DRAFT_946020 [Suillus americanus]|nr:hypothetical protein BDR03DRAFT_946020 [Suillus americanus]
MIRQKEREIMNNMRYLREVFWALCFEAAALVVLFEEVAPRLSVFDDLPVAVFLALPCAVAAFLPTVLRVEEPVVLAFFAVE